MNAYHNMDIFTEDQGLRYSVFHRTNDDADIGWPSIDSQWSVYYPTLEKALLATGATRIGVSGIRVNVTLDGENVDSATWETLMQKTIEEQKEQVRREEEERNQRYSETCWRREGNGYT